jgi:hypothetical protein
VKNIDNNTIEYYVHHKWEWIQSFPLIFLIILMIFFNILIVWNFTPHNFFVWHGHLHVYCCCYYCMVIVAIVSMCLLNLLVILCLSAFIPFFIFSSFLTWWRTNLWKTWSTSTSNLLEV